MACNLYTSKSVTKVDGPPWGGGRNARGPLGGDGPREGTAQEQLCEGLGFKEGAPGGPP